MRILFVLDRVENPASANAQLACRLAEQLLAQGHEIHLLGPASTHWPLPMSG